MCRPDDQSIVERMEKIGVVRGFLNTFDIPYDWIGRWCWILEKVSCKSLVVVEFCTSPESEMKAEGERLEGVGVLTITEADDGTCADPIEETRESMLNHKEKGQPCLALRCLRCFVLPCGARGACVALYCLAALAVLALLACLRCLRCLRC